MTAISPTQAAELFKLAQALYATAAKQDALRGLDFETTKASARALNSAAQDYREAARNLLTSLALQVTRYPAPNGVAWAFQCRGPADAQDLNLVITKLDNFEYSPAGELQSLVLHGTDSAKSKHSTVVSVPA